MKIWMHAIFAVLVLSMAGTHAHAQETPEVTITKLIRIHFGGGADGPQGQQVNPQGNAPKINMLARWAEAPKWRQVDEEIVNLWGNEFYCANGEYFWAHNYGYHTPSDDYFTILCATR